MIPNDLKFYNIFFSSQDGIKLLTQFTLNQKEKLFEGDIIVTAKNNKELKFSVRIPENYPLNDISFISNDLEGYPHQNYDKSLCLNTAFINHKLSRLELDIDKLRNYISRYYDHELLDDYYEYPAFEDFGVMTLLFQENDYDKDRFLIPFGEFDYTVVNILNNNKSKATQLTICALNLGNKQYKWNKKYSDKKIFHGIWLFLGKEPVYKKKQKILIWEDLVQLCPEHFEDFFSNFCKKSANYRVFPSEFAPYIVVSIGYIIPAQTHNEVHWDIALLPRGDFPRKINQSRQFITHYKGPILWDSTYNTSYDRFFGRGKISIGFASKKILIIGIGAIGSQLSEVLTRSGAKRISLSDIDYIEPGNICRSSYDFCDIGLSKSLNLKDKLECISPFIEIEILENLKPVSINSIEGKDLFNELCQFEIIFDCSANNKIIQMLTDFHLSSCVFYISITNKANEMVCISNQDNWNMIERRNQMLYSFGSYAEAEFREGTGCWHPTFEASYFDINQLLHYTVRKINSFYKQSAKLRTFYSFFRNEIIASSEDIKYIQPELNLTLVIESQCLSQIREYAESFYPYEYGGVLIGSYLNDYMEVIISDVICPSHFYNTKVLFEPDPEEINNKLRELYEVFDGKIEYLGDWHSHPEGSNKYSHKDYKSIETVAKSKTVNTHNPILLIVAFSENYFDPGFYVYNNEKLYKYVQITGVV